jgi:hypothetical protein
MYDIVNNPIPRSGLWATPQTEQDLYDAIENVSSNDNEKRIAWIGAMLALNWANKEVADILSKEVFGQ